MDIVDMACDGSIIESCCDTWGGEIEDLDAAENDRTWYLRGGTETGGRGKTLLQTLTLLHANVINYFFEVGADVAQEMVKCREGYLRRAGIKLQTSCVVEKMGREQVRCFASSRVVISFLCVVIDQIRSGARGWDWHPNPPSTATSMPTAYFPQEDKKSR